MVCAQLYADLAFKRQVVERGWSWLKQVRTEMSYGSVPSLAAHLQCKLLLALGEMRGRKLLFIFVSKNIEFVCSENLK